jgi:hypothetical protein
VVPLPSRHDTAHPDWDSAYLDNVDRRYRLVFSKVRNRPDAEDLILGAFRAAPGPWRLATSKRSSQAAAAALAAAVDNAQSPQYRAQRMAARVSEELDP